MRKNGIYKKCSVCNSEFYIPKYRIKEARFCSRKCLGKAFTGRVAWNKGKDSPFKGQKRDPSIGRKISISKTGKKRPPFSEEWKKNMVGFKKGYTPWNVGMTGEKSVS